MCGFHRAPMIMTGAVAAKQSSVPTKRRKYPALFPEGSQGLKQWRWIKKEWCTRTTEHHSATKRSEAGPFAEVWVHLETVPQREVGQREEGRRCTVTHRHGIWRQSYVQSRKTDPDPDRDTDGEQTSGSPGVGGGRAGRVNWGTGVAIYTLLIV